PALNSSLKLRRVRFRFVSAIVDIVSLSGKVSTKPDQAHCRTTVFETGQQRNGDKDATSAGVEGLGKTTKQNQAH
ncbi:MAG: hypothetical protein ACT4QD_05490, partial [Acidobacteriota bacterium]